MKDEPVRTVWFDLVLKCPRCTSPLLTNGSLVWCSFAGGLCGKRLIPACSFGVETKVRREEVGGAK